MVSIKINRLDGFDPEVPLPAYETTGAAGADIRANLPAEQRKTGIVLAPGVRALVPSGLSMEIPPGYEVQLRPRSGLCLKHGLTLVNAPGTIDADYRGPVGMIMINLGQEPFTITHGERLAQIVVAPALQATFEQVESLSQTGRGTGGFGSTGRD